jgi:hypothetical protein
MNENVDQIRKWYKETSSIQTNFHQRIKILLDEIDRLQEICRRQKNIKEEYGYADSLLI